MRKRSRYGGVPIGIKHVMGGVTIGKKKKKGTTSIYGVDPIGKNKNIKGGVRIGKMK